MWMNPDNYKYIDDARKILNLLQDILVKDDHNLTFEIFPESMRLRYRPNRTDMDWVGVLLFLRGKSNVNLDHIDPRFSVIMNILENNHSFIEAAINFVGPNSITPLHSDKGAYVYDSWAIEPSYQLVGGIYSPKGDIGLEMNGVAKSWSAGEFVAFDGSTEHHGWNRTNEFRISLYLDVRQGDFVHTSL